MDKELSPLATTLILAFFLILGGLLYWSYSRYLDTPRLTHMRLDPMGQLYVQLGSELFVYGPDGQYADWIDLANLGAESRIGDFAFFSDGDLLIRQGGGDRSLAFNILRYLRVTNRTPDTRVEGADGGLIRCDLDNLECQPFGDPPPNLNDAFHLELDWKTDRVFLADTSRHRIQMLSPGGTRVARAEGSLRFPNQTLYRDGELFVANTNCHEIAVFAAADDQLTPLVERGFPTVPEGADLAGRIWPTALLTLDEEIWVINSDHAMSKGLGLRFTPSGRLLGRLEAPDDADLFALARFNDQVLATDYANHRIYRYALDGRRLGDFEGGPLKARVAALAAQRRPYLWWMTLLGSLFVGALLLGLVVGIRQQLAD